MQTDLATARVQGTRLMRSSQVALISYATSGRAHPPNKMLLPTTLAARSISRVSLTQLSNPAELAQRNWAFQTVVVQLTAIAEGKVTNKL